MSPEAAHANSTDKLIYMANQIGAFFASQGADKAVAGTAE
ncbi:MAG: formate dehydrogenase subunit delta, partial [Xanthobacteraceae bacterium]